MPSSNVKLVVFVPESHADRVRDALGAAGAGGFGNYSHCSFTTKGIGRFKPETGANPHIGIVGELESVAEDRIEVVCPRDKLAEIIKAMRRVHPYEEVAFDLVPLEDPPAP